MAPSEQGHIDLGEVKATSEPEASQVDATSCRWVASQLQNCKRISLPPHKPVSQHRQPLSQHSQSMSSSLTLSCASQVQAGFFCSRAGVLVAHTNHLPHCGSVCVTMEDTRRCCGEPTWRLEAWVQEVQGKNKMQRPWIQEKCCCKVCGTEQKGCSCFPPG